MNDKDRIRFVAGRRYERRNRQFWDRDSDAYQRRHGPTLRRKAMAWGVWRIPESRLKVLGDVRGMDVLELGCGAARWSVALARRGARPVGMDLSGGQLGHARKELARARTSFPLVQANAEELPFGDGSFDLVFCDHGAMNFADPRRAVPEAARVLRPGGLLAFSHETPFRFVCWDPKTERTGRTLATSYFEMKPGEDEETAVFQLTYGEWLSAFRDAGLEVEDLIEPRPPAGAKTTYEDFDIRWARKWPAEAIWRARKRGTAAPGLVGVTEAARILGWDRRRVMTYVRRGTFPRPVASLAGGRVWAEDDVRAFARTFQSRQRARGERRGWRRGDRR